MKENNSQQKYTLLPCQLVGIDRGVILKRGVNQLKIEGEIAFDLVQVIMKLTENGGLMEEEILAYFNSSLEKAIKELLFILKSRELLVELDKQPKIQNQELNDVFRNSIFNWNLGLKNEVTKKAFETPISILGINMVSRQLIQSLKWSGFNNITVVDAPLFRNIGLFDISGKLIRSGFTNIFDDVLPYENWKTQIEIGEEIDLLVCTSDFGGHQLMKPFNKFCIDNEIPFLPVVLNDLQGYVGPLVIPHESSCLDCLISRQDSNNSNHIDLRTVELSSYEGQKIIGFHPSMASIVGDIASVEIYKFLGELSQSWNIGKILEINLLQSSMKTKKLLKAPRCPSCSNTQKMSSYATSSSEFMPVHNE